MEKIAQKRSFLNKLREMAGGVTEKFSPEFEAVMNNLRMVDNNVRSIISGEEITTDTSPDTFKSVFLSDIFDKADKTISLKDLLKSTKSNINKREYIKAAADLGRFHKKMDDVVKILNGFKFNIDEMHEKFLFEGLDDESKSHLSDMRRRFKATQSSQNYNLIKEADFLDFFTNIVSERGKSLSTWEKNYPKKVGKLSKDTSNMLTLSERLMASALSALKIMASARASRNPDKYIVEAEKIVKAYDNYNKNFMTYYNSNIKDVLDKQKWDADNQTEELAPVAPTPSVPAPSLPVPSQAPKLAPLPTVAPPPLKDDEPEIAIDSPTVSSPPPQVDEEEAFELQSPGPKTMSYLEPAKKAHTNFYSVLESMSSESPKILSAFISKYAQSIKSSDPKTYIKLVNIINSIK